MSSRPVQVGPSGPVCTGCTDIAAIEAAGEAAGGSNSDMANAAGIVASTGPENRVCIMGGTVAVAYESDSLCPISRWRSEYATMIADMAASMSAALMKPLVSKSAAGNAAACVPLAVALIT